MREPFAICGICGEQICLEPPADDEMDGRARLKNELAAAIDAHVRSRAEAELELFWLRRSLDDLPPVDRALAAREIYSKLRDLWGDSDRLGVYSIEEVLGSVSMYRLWLQTHRCSYHGCRHGEPQAVGGGSRELARPRVLAEGIAPPKRWHGTRYEWDQLMAAVVRNCTCASSSLPVACAAHQLTADERLLGRLVFSRRLRARLFQEEFGSLPIAPVPRTRPGPACAPLGQERGTTLR